MKKLLLIGCLFCAMSSFAQDIHFSQFFAAPILTNPANTGNFNGAARIGLNYRDQWRSVTVPYQTFSVYADGAIQPKKAENRLGLGLVAFNDEAGDGVLTTQKAYFTGAYHINYTENSSWRLAFGMAGGYVQKSVDITKLTFDTQWDNYSFDPTLSNQENPLQEKTEYFDFSAGTMLTLIPWEGERYQFGFSAWHITQPEETFFDTGNKVGIKYTATAGAFLASGGVASFQPQLYISTQKNSLEIIAGSNVSFPIDEESEAQKSVFAGLWYRHADAMWFVGGAILGNFTASMSYDMNISQLSPASNNLGAFELALVYTFNRAEKKDPLKCPAYE